MPLNDGYQGADYGDPTTDARIDACDAMADLIADAIQAGVSIEQLDADFGAQLSLHVERSA